ncbi:MAG: hypothetical protein ACOVQM_16545, partial [Pirellula sp.]
MCTTQVGRLGLVPVVRSFGVLKIDSALTSYFAEPSTASGGARFGKVGAANHCGARTPKRGPVGAS